MNRDRSGRRAHWQIEVTSVDLPGGTEIIHQIISTMITCVQAGF
jgi:hypothetical protein